MTPVLRLQIHRWVPISIVENNRISSCQIDADPATTRGRYKAQHFRIAVELIDYSLSLGHLNTPIQSHVGEVMQIHEFLQNV